MERSASLGRRGAKGKRLVVCCDGTWNFADQPSKTNVTKIALAVRRGLSAGGMEQRVYYHSGVGTHWWDHLRGGAFGVGLSGNIIDAYRFLVEAYEPGDELFLFGFSRGAFTARSLAGLVSNSGIVRREHAEQVKEAWALYRDRLESPTGVASTLFRRSYAYETKIRFIGVWDTVGALGIPVPRATLLKPAVKQFDNHWGFHNTELSIWVEGAFQALAIDEQRSAFQPTPWHQLPNAPKGQVLKQVWFAGAHGDVGGGEKETGLSDLALLWMVKQAHSYKLEFNADVLSANGPSEMNPSRSIDFCVQPNFMGGLHPSRKKLWRLGGLLERPIGQIRVKNESTGRLDGNEFLADPAEERYLKDPDYRPPELTKYLDHPEHVRRESVPADVVEALTSTVAV